MVLEAYTLGTLLEQIRRELGLDDVGNTNDRIKDKINQAQAWVAGRRDWPWLRKELNIDVSVPTTMNVNVVQGSNEVEIVDIVGTLPSPRDIFTVSSSGGDQTSGYIIAEVNGTTLVLQSQYRGADAELAAAVVTKGFFQLPDDFLRGEALVKFNALGECRPIFRNAKEFDFIRKNTLILSMRGEVYTVCKDPLDEEENFYLGVYPYIGERSSYQFTYARVPQKLVDGADKSIIPRNDRIVLFHLGCWYMAQALGNENFVAYRDAALQKIEDMLSHSDLVDEEENRSETDYDSVFIRGPSNYPSFDDA